MFYAVFEELSVEVVVDGFEEIRFAAVKDDVQLSGFQLSGDVGNGVSVPGFPVLGVFAECPVHFPFVGKFSYVDPPACASGVAEDVAVSDREIECAVSTHA